MFVSACVHLAISFIHGKRQQRSTVVPFTVTIWRLLRCLAIVCTKLVKFCVRRVIYPWKRNDRVDIGNIALLRRRLEETSEAERIYLREDICGGGTRPFACRYISERRDLPLALGIDARIASRHLVLSSFHPSLRENFIQEWRENEMGTFCYNFSKYALVIVSFVFLVSLPSRLCQIDTRLFPPPADNLIHRDIPFCRRTCVFLSSQESRRLSRIYFINYNYVIVIVISLYFINIVLLIYIFYIHIYIRAYKFWSKRSCETLLSL